MTPRHTGLERTLRGRESRRVGSTERYSSDGGRRYRARYRDPERRSKAKAGFLTRREAEAFLNAVSTSVAHGAYIDPSDARATVGDLGPGWLETQTHLKPSSYATLETAWRVYVAPRWGETEVGRIRHSDVQAWVAQLIKGTAPSIHPQHPLGATSVIRAYGVLASILDTAVRDRRLSANPARGVHLPRKHGKRHAYLSHQQVELLARCANDKGTLVRFLAYTGLCCGEAVCAARPRDRLRAASCLGGRERGPRRRPDHRRYPEIAPRPPGADPAVFWRLSSPNCLEDAQPARSSSATACTT